MKESAVYPDQYLHVREMVSGQEWIIPLRGNATLDLEKQAKKWVKSEFSGELKLVGFQPRLEGQFFGQIITDGRSPDSGVVWESGGFWTESTY
jgi:hypothetical protein